VLILLLAAINLVHLLLARGVSRAGEIATRAALGASPWRVGRLFLTESLALAVVGIAGGLLVGSWLADLIEASIPRLPTRGRNMALGPMLFDWRVVAFASVLGLAVALTGGLWPARRALGRSLSWTSRSAAGLAAAIPVRLSRSILASELAVATVVMIGTLFIGLGIWRYLHQPLGFDYRDRFDVILSRNAVDMVPPEELEAAIGALQRLPGVTAAGPSRIATLRGVEVPGRALDPAQVGARGVSKGYGEVWGLRLRAGRWFTPQEFTGDQPVVIVDQTFARLAWEAAEAVGQDVRVGGVLRKVIGVIEPQRQSLAREGPGQALVPVSQTYRFSSPVVWAPGLSPAELRRRAAQAIGAVLPGVDVEVRPVSLENLFLREIGEAQFQGPIVVAFGVLAFVLAGIGVFGLVSYLVEQRTREFGIRFALGARPQDVWRSVIRQSVVPALAGIAIGVGGAWALESIVRSSVFGWQSSGAGAASAVAVALIAVTILAAAVPARRAMRIDPAVTLKAE
jgi:predicted permease